MYKIGTIVRKEKKIGSEKIFHKRMGVDEDHDVIVQLELTLRTSARLAEILSLILRG